MASRFLLRQTPLYRNRHPSLLLGSVRSVSIKKNTPTIMTNNHRMNRSSLRRLLVTSIPCYYLSAASTAEGFRLQSTFIRNNPVSIYNPQSSPNFQNYCNTLRLFSTDSKTQGDETFSTSYHAPVMVNECLDALLDCQRGRIRNPKSFKKKKKARKSKRNKNQQQETIETEAASTESPSIHAPDAPPLIFVDGTLGGGGHSNAILERLRPGDILFGCDVDPNALNTASERLATYMGHSGDDRPLFVPVRTNFGDLAQNLPGVVHPVTNEPILNETNGVDGILLDLGVSSHQIDEPERGFSFMRDGPLDMRMGSNSETNSGGITAADICNEFDEAEIQRLLSVYGDEPRAKTIAKAIVNHRPMHTTGELVEAIASVTPTFAKNKRHGKTATCARVFQSLRIVVNNEDGVLSKVLSEACPNLLRPGGMLVVMSYHSMEDRATKRIMRDGTLDATKRPTREEKDIYGNYVGPPKPFKPVQKRQKATQEEIDRNPRARSAILRVAERQDS